MKISPARIAAYGALLRIERDGAFFSAAADQFEKDLEDQDRRLAHELILGCLRTQIILDDTIDRSVKGKNLDVEIRVILRLGIYQIHFADKIPVHAAINESVELAKFARKTSAKGLVNAVLRRAEIRDPSSIVDPIKRVAFENSHPIWLIEKWAKQFGLEKTESIAKANNERSELSFRLTAAGRAADFPIDEIGAASEIIAGAFTCEKMTIELRSAVRDGLVVLQDRGSQLVPSAMSIERGWTVLDVCAAPGGKSELLAERAGLVVDGEIHKHRALAMRDRFERTGYRNIRIAGLDATDGLPYRDGSFDAILIDAPCTGTGTIRSNPEIRYRITAADIEELAIKQSTILANCARLVRIGGEILYSTCSLEFEEGEAVIDAFLDSDERFELSEPNLPKRFITDKGFGRTFPDRDGMDGFFISRMKRIR